MTASGREKSRKVYEDRFLPVAVTMKNEKKEEKIVAELYNMNDMMEMLDDAERKTVLSKMHDYLMERGGCQQKKAGSGQTDGSKSRQWKLAGRDGEPKEQQMLYLTVQEEGNGTRSLIEGFMEDGNWYDEEGIVLDAKGMTVVAWLPKDVPEIYLGDTDKSGKKFD